MGTFVGPDTQFSEFVSWLGTQPADTELAELADAYEAAYTKQQAMLEHQRAIVSRLRDVEAQLLTADPAAWPKLITERAQLLTQQDIIPAAVAAHRQRTAETHLRWLRRLDQLARAVVESAAARLAPGQAQSVQLGKQLDRIDRNIDLPQDARVAEHVRLMEEARRLHDSMRDDRERLHAAQTVASIIRCRVEQRYGDDLDLYNERTWEPALQRLTNSIRRSQAVRPLVPA